MTGDSRYRLLDLTIDLARQQVEHMAEVRAEIDEFASAVCERHAG